ncbi:MAG: hypothetical protein NT091_00580 [Candidatus Falkowbacteria bacterium]|nr:hypothetical protein [Candidatus Falkowbacteria bacterium]
MAQNQQQQNILEINKFLLSHLNKREQDIISRRFGLAKTNKQTLEEIGKDHNLTRERIRQLEAAALKKIKDLESLEAQVSNLSIDIKNILAEYGGLVELNYLLENLILPYKITADVGVYKNNLYFVISRLLHEQFDEIQSSEYLKTYLKKKDEDVDHIEEIVKELSEVVKQKNTVLTTKEIINTIKNLESHCKHEKKLVSGNTIDLSEIIKEVAKDEFELLNDNKILYSLLVAAEEIAQNKLGYWGISEWSEIKPKTINEKIYLILKENKNPMHFTEIAEGINKVGFDKKKANAATVHNELILGDKYVLVGRGMYTLTEWGYKKGTVTEIIGEIIENADKKLTREEIVDEVLKQRLVKRTTVILALTNNKQFVKEGDNYTIKKTK